MVAAVEGLGGAPIYQAAGIRPPAPVSVPQQPRSAPVTEGGRAFLSIAELGGRATLAANFLQGSPESTFDSIAQSFTSARRQPAAGQRELVQGTFGFRQNTPDVVRAEGGDGRVIFQIARTETGGEPTRVGEVVRTVDFEAKTAAAQDLTISTPGSNEAFALPFPETSIGAYTPNVAVQPERWNLSA